MATCGFDGNPDMYGLGIRIGFYLQWYGGISASLIAKSEVPGMRISSGLFIAATFLALVIETARGTSALKVAEIYVILLLTFGGYVAYVPIYLWRLATGCNASWDPSRYPRVHPSSMYSNLNFLLIFAVSSFQIWFWVTQVPQLAAQDCQEFGFFFAKIRLNEKAFQVLNIVIHSLLLLCCFWSMLWDSFKRFGLVDDGEASRRRRHAIPRIPQTRARSSANALITERTPSYVLIPFSGDFRTAI